MQLLVQFNQTCPSYENEDWWLHWRTEHMKRRARKSSALLSWLIIDDHFPSVAWHHFNIKHSRSPPVFNCTYNYGDVRQMWPPWLISAFKQIIMHGEHDLKELKKPVRVASAAHSANEILRGGTLWGYPALLSCWIASHHGAALLATFGAGFDKTQLQALVLPVKPPQFPHSQTAGCRAGKKRWLCLCPARSHRNGGWMPWWNSFIWKGPAPPFIHLTLWDLR